MSKILLFQVQLEHGGGDKEAGPWEVNIDHTSTNCVEEEAIMIVATVTGEGSRIQMLSFHALCSAVQKEEIFLQWFCQEGRSRITFGRDHTHARGLDFISEHNPFRDTYS
jgi:hypothetical protein